LEFIPCVTLTGLADPNACDVFADDGTHRCDVRRPAPGDFAKDLCRAAITIFYLTQEILRMTEEQRNKKRQAGRLGGLKTLERRGREYFSTIGKRGADAFHKRYRLEPVYQNDFAIVRRETGEIVNYLSGDFYKS